MIDGGGRDPFTLPLLLRFPSLVWVPRVRLGAFPTPVERLPGDGGELWIKREDLSGSPSGGNKVRSLEFLLAGVRPGDHVITTGARGSTHALATARYGRALGGRVTVVRWPQELNPDAIRVADAITRTADETRDARSTIGALVTAGLLRLTRGGHWIPPGGTSARGALGHVNAALELGEQIATSRMPRPARIVVPLGSGGTAAGLALGLAIAGLPIPIVCVAVAPGIVANRRHVLAIARRCARFIERSAGVVLPRPSADRLIVDRAQYGGAYGRSTADCRDAALWLESSTGIPADITYSAKALAAARAIARHDAGPTLFWLTYDGRASVPVSVRV